MDRRSRKKQAVRQALEEAALRLFDERGFAETTIEHIADAADVSRSTFFRYFGSKEAVLFSGYDENGEKLAKLILERPEDEAPLQAFENALVELPGAMAAAPNPTHSDQRRRILEANIALRSKSEELMHQWRFRIAETLAQRDGKEKPGREHLLAAAVGIVVAERVSEEFVQPHVSLDLEGMIRGQFALLRELVS